MNLLHVVPTYLPAYTHGGPIHSVHGLCRTLAARGHRVRVLTTDVHGPGRLDVPLGEPVDRDGVEVRYFPVDRFPPLRRLYRSPALGRALREAMVETDLLHLHSVFLWPTAVAARTAARRNVPYLLAPRGMLVPELVAERGRLRKSLWLRLVERKTLREAAALHVTTALEARDASRLGLPLPPVRIVPNGIDLAPFRRPNPEGARRGDRLTPSPEPSEPGGPFVLALGRVSWKKGLDRLVRALALLTDGPAAPWSLAIAGPDEEGHRVELEALATRLGVRDRVRFLGPVHGTAKVDLLREARALVLPSRSENFANVVLEAMAAATPVLVTPEVGLAELVDRSGAGRVVPGEPEALATALAGLAANPDDARAMGRRGAAAAEELAWPVIAERMEEVYREVLDRRGGRRR